MCRAKTFHSSALSVLRGSFSALGLAGDNVDTDLGELLDETGGDIEVCNIKVMAFLNSRFPPPKLRALAPHEVRSSSSATALSRPPPTLPPWCPQTRVVLLSLEVVLFSSAVNSTYIQALQAGMGLPGCAS